MTEKTKECFKPHALMHSFLGLGLGILLALYVPVLANVWVALGIVVLAIVADMMRK